jgi:hypothetical protein
MDGSGDGEKARYIASMCVELAKLAEQSGFSTCAYLLRMACLELADIRRESELTLRDSASTG